MGRGNSFSRWLGTNRAIDRVELANCNHWLVKALSSIVLISSLYCSAKYKRMAPLLKSYSGSRLALKYSNQWVLVIFQTDWFHEILFLDSHPLDTLTQLICSRWLFLHVPARQACPPFLVLHIVSTPLNSSLISIMYAAALPGRSHCYHNSCAGCRSKFIDNSVDWAHRLVHRPGDMLWIARYLAGGESYAW